MEEITTAEAEEELSFSPHPNSTVAIAIGEKQKCKKLVKWALDKFIPEGKVMFKLIHVYPRITAVPIALGSFIPVSEVRDDVTDAYRKEVVCEKHKMLLPFKNMCVERKVLVDNILIESDDVPDSIAKEIAKNSITNLVIGVPSANIFKRKNKKRNLSARISESTPSFCSVYAISKGYLSSVRVSDSETSGSSVDDSSDMRNSSRHSTSSPSVRSSSSSYSQFHPSSLPAQRFQALSAINHNFLDSRKNLSRCQSAHQAKKDDFANLNSGNAVVSHTFQRNLSLRSLQEDSQSWISNQVTAVDDSPTVSSGSQINLNHELERLRLELRHVKGMYAVAQTQTIDASLKLNSINRRRLEEESKLRELNLMEEKARESVTQEKEKYEAAKREAEHMRRCAEREARQSKVAEEKALNEDTEKEKLEHAFLGTVELHQKFTWEEIQSATSSFSEKLRIGMGAYGVVYKCAFHRTAAAVKVLHSKEAPKTKQFKKELEILSKIRHPHLLLLLGASPDHGCIIYEYMENGSLEDRLFRKNNTPPIPWFDRIRIAREVASALVFLHNLKPEPIVHRDLKPENILLDHNFVSKIGDVGLAKMLQVEEHALSLMYKDPSIVGTICYLDPEYQRTGINSPKSDVYAFGIVILQLLTAKPAMALAHIVETAVADDKLVDILDAEAGEWPVEETKELLALGVSCSEIRRKDRPDLKDDVLPTLERLEKVASRARNAASRVSLLPPIHFTCPIRQEMMEEPCVAADGYTYDRKAIELWLEENDNSPMTDMLLPNKNLIPNYSLLSAIMEWKSKRR